MNRLFGCFLNHADRPFYFRKSVHFHIRTQFETEKEGSVISACCQALPNTITGHVKAEKAIELERWSVIQEYWSEIPIFHG